MDDAISHEVTVWRALRERIAAAEGIAEDDPALIDTLDGETTLNERLAKLAISANEDKAFAAACKALVEQYQERSKRIMARSDSKRRLIAWAMQETGQASIPGPQVTLSMRMGSPKLVIDDEKLSREYMKSKVSYVPDKEAIQAAIDTGNVPEGVQIDNAEPILTVRVK